ncbi:hypothetical protein [Aquibium sp. ELW1220]|uniref:hypothetical protein n=1 Tax=Aquibium sp. ELW1220 TaxID=2976766 RepID=UPI0025AFD1B2|nr:hypothetical protein [Aquibium sp. ELW1220]
MEQSVVFACALLNILLMFVAFRRQMLFVFFSASFSFAYFMLRPILVYHGFYFRYRALYPEFLLIPPSYWGIAALLAIINVVFLFWLYLRFGKQEQSIWANWTRIPERNPDRAGFFAAILAALFVHGEAAYYFCLAYLIVYKARVSTKLSAAAIVMIFAVTTEDRRHFVGVLILVLVALIQANKNSFTKASISSLLTRTVYLAIGVIGVILIVILSIYYRSPENLQSIMNWRNATVIIEMQLDFAHIPEVMVKMRIGGESNRSIGKIFLKSREDLRALRRHDVGSFVALSAKNIRKIVQFI